MWAALPHALMFRACTGRGLLGALENLHAEHQLVIQREDAMDEEQNRKLARNQDVKDSCVKDKKHLEERTGALLKEKEACVPDVQTEV